MAYALGVKHPCPPPAPSADSAGLRAATSLKFSVETPFAVLDAANLKSSDRDFVTEMHLKSLSGKKISQTPLFRCYVSYKRERSLLLYIDQHRTGE